MEMNVWFVVLVGFAALVAGIVLGVGVPELSEQGVGSCPDCYCGSCSAEFEPCPPQNVTIVYHNCEASELKLT